MALALEESSPKNQCLVSQTSKQKEEKIPDVELRLVGFVQFCNQ